MAGFVGPAGDALDPMEAEEIERIKRDRLDGSQGFVGPDTDESVMVRAAPLRKAGPTAAYQQPESLFTDTSETKTRGAPTQVVQQPPKANGWLEGAARMITGDGRKEEGVGEIGSQPVPIQTEADITKPETWLDDMGRAAKIGAGMFLDANPRSRMAIIKTQVPSSEFRRDQYGNVQVRYTKDRPWAYLNRPGFSESDALTLASELEKFWVASKIPGLRLSKAAPAAAGAATVANAGRVATPALTAGAKLAGQGAVSVAAPQEAAKVFGGRGAQAEDVIVGAGANVAGGVIGHTIQAGAKAAPKVAQAIGQEIGDRLPGGAQRAVERSQQAVLAQQASENAARVHAEQTVRALAAQRSLEGEALEAAVKEAQDSAAAEVARQWGQGAPGAKARELDRLAQAFGVRLAKAQTEGDQAGMAFMYEAAGGLHGPAAQRQATAFLQAQNEALPQAIKAIAGDAGVTSPQAGVNAARGGAERAYGAARDAEGAAWDAFDSAVKRVRTTDKTPAGNAGGAEVVLGRIAKSLQDSKVFMNLPEYAAQYPRVERSLRLAEKMASTSGADLPLKDVDRVIQLKRFIDGAWEEAGTDAERRLLTIMGKEVRAWLKTDASKTLGGRGANVTRARLKEALAISEANAKTFRENAIMRDIVKPEKPLTDDEIATRLFGGGEGGIRLGSDSVAALKALKQALGPASPEWEALRQAALQRLTRGLDDAVETNQTPAILTTFKRIEEAFRKSREGMSILFTTEELATLREAQRVVAAMAPTAKNPVNPSGSGLVAGRVAKGILTTLMQASRNIPGANIVAGGAMDVGAAARVGIETGGASSPTYNIAREVADLWNVRASAGGPAYSAYEQTRRSTPNPEPGYYSDASEASDEDLLRLGGR